MQCQWPGRSSVSKFMSGRLNKRGYYPSDHPSIDVHLLDSRCAQIAARVTKILPNNLVSEKPVELGKLIQVAYLVPFSRCYYPLPFPAAGRSRCRLWPSTGLWTVFTNNFVEP